MGSPVRDGPDRVAPAVVSGSPRRHDGSVKATFGRNADGGPEPQRNDRIPDVRDGLTREERLVLYVLHQTQKERGDRNVPTAMLWGRVCEHFYISPDELSAMLARLGARR
jgi:hypothetical protein